MIADLLIRALKWCARHTPPNVITGLDDSPYLSRYFIFRHSVRTEALERGEKVKDPPRWGLYLHHFHRGDADRELHNHPWKWAVSLVLKNGYSEERRIDLPNGRKHVMRIDVKPWTLNFLQGDTFHRVDLPRGEAWTLFLVGPVIQSWGFWNRHTDRFIPWKQFLGIEGQPS